MDLVHVVKQKLDETLHPKPDGYSIDNNRAERAMKSVAIGRKNWRAPVARKPGVGQRV